MSKYFILCSYLIFTMLVASSCGADSTMEAAIPAAPTASADAAEDPITPAAGDHPKPTLTLVEGLFSLGSPAFKIDEEIPARYSCHGENVSPPLEWGSPPGGTQSYVLIMDDPDAVQVAGFVWDHWLIFNIPAEVQSLPEGVPGDGELHDGSRQGTNTFKKLGYGGPCPPSGQSHQYVFALYALDTILSLDPGVTKDQLRTAMDGHVLGETITIGVYTSP